MFLAYSPGRALSPYIVKLWYAELTPLHALERVLPCGDMAMVSNLHDAELRVYERSGSGPQRFVGPTISGAYSRDFVIDTRLQRSLIGVQFRPGGAYPFLGASADALHNRHVALEDLWGRSAVELQARLMEERTVHARFLCLAKALEARLDGARRSHPAVESALSAFTTRRGVASIRVSATTVGLSWRRFIELFRREVGVTPKTFCRTRRFQHVVQRLAAGASSHFAELAQRCGYSDQAHLIRDFKDFTELTPMQYVAMRGERPNYVPVKNVQYARGP